MGLAPLAPLAPLACTRALRSLRRGLLLRVERAATLQTSAGVHVDRVAAKVHRALGLRRRGLGFGARDTRLGVARVGGRAVRVHRARVVRDHRLAQRASARRKGRPCGTSVRAHVVLRMRRGRVALERGHVGFGARRGQGSFHLLRASTRGEGEQARAREQRHHGEFRAVSSVAREVHGAAIAEPGRLATRFTPASGAPMMTR